LESTIVTHNFATLPLLGKALAAFAVILEIKN